MSAHDLVSSSRPLRTQLARPSSPSQASATPPIRWASFSSRMLSTTPLPVTTTEPTSSVMISSEHIPSSAEPHDLPNSYRHPFFPNSARSHDSHSNPVSFSDTRDNIRDRTVELSSFPVSSPLSPAMDAYFPPSTRLPTVQDQPEMPEISPEFPETPEIIKSSPELGKPRLSSYKGAGPSSLTIQLQRHSNPASTQTSREVSPIRPIGHTSSIPELSITAPSPPEEGVPPRSIIRIEDHHRPSLDHIGRIPMSGILPTDITPLLSDDTTLPSYIGGGDYSARPEVRRARSLSKHFRLAVGSSIDYTKTVSQPGFIKSLLLRTVSCLPAVFLGLLLNVLDGVSYGMILFPAGPIFDGFGPMGVSMFFVSTIVAQLVYTFGGSSFAGGNGSMIIEVVPFFNILANQIIEIIGEDDAPAVIATTLVAFSLSAVLTGITFFILGRFRMGALIGFFPRHILVGCIGGVGWFLIETGFEVSTGMNEEGGFQYNMETLKFFFSTGRVMGLWMSALGLAVLLRVITEKYHHQLIFPIYFLFIPAIFYIVVGVGHLNISHLRQTGWLFDVGDVHEPWWKIYTYWDLRKVNYFALLQTMPTQLALLFFNILHPPLNVPALAVSLGQEVDTNRELVAHGYSNILSGFAGSIPNYLVYVNTVIFYRVGGTTRLAGFLLALATAVIMMAGTGPIGYLPVMLVAALIFILGLDLVREAVWHTRHRVSKTEYVTILSIIVCMTIFDFVTGVLFGIVLASFFFVVQNSQNRSIRALYTGDTAMSTVRRPSAHRKYLQEVGRQTAIMKLQSYLFFGTITYVEEAARQLLDAAKWNHNPIRFLVIDLSLVLGVDLSASEAFVRLQRLLGIKNVTMVLCGFQLDSAIGRALKCVDLFDAENVEVFSDINEAIEWTENVYLKAWFDTVKDEQRANEVKSIALPGRAKVAFAMGESWQQSPRRSQIQNVGGRLMQTLLGSPDESSSSLSPETPDIPEPAHTLVKTFSGYETDLTPLFFLPILRYFIRLSMSEGQQLWRRGDAPDGIYVVESGVLRATYDWDNTDVITESMVSGTLAGELSGLANMPRNSTVVAEKLSVVWKLDKVHWSRFKEEQPGMAHRFIELVLKVAKNDYDILISACSRR